MAWYPLAAEQDLSDIGALMNPRDHGVNTHAKNTIHNDFDRPA